MKNWLLLLVLSLAINQTINAINTITFYIRPYRPDKKLDADKLRNNLGKTGKITSKSILNHLDNKTNDGIFVSYWGYMAVSDFLGQVRFPRKQQNEKLKILITERIKPIFMISNTIHHWQIEENAPAALYSFERIKKNKKYYWSVQEMPLPDDQRIQLDTIIIFSKPKDIHIATGEFETTDNPQLLLPDIYAKKTLNRLSPALWILKMRQFFGPMRTEWKKFSDTYYSEQLIP